MAKTTAERRSFDRFETEAKVYFYVSHDLKTKIKYQIVDTADVHPGSPKHLGISKNISAGGICFVSEQKLDAGQMLHIEVYLPKREDPIPMFGEVRWSRESALSHKHDLLFETGVKLVKVGDNPVAESIHYDEGNKIVWSVVLESVFGTFRIMQQQQKKSAKSS